MVSIEFAVNTMTFNTYVKLHAQNGENPDLVYPEIQEGDEFSAARFEKTDQGMQVADQMNVYVAGFEGGDHAVVFIDDRWINSFPLTEIAEGKVGGYQLSRRVRAVEQQKPKIAAILPERTIDRITRELPAKMIPRVFRRLTERRSLARATA